LIAISATTQSRTASGVNAGAPASLPLPPPVTTLAVTICGVTTASLRRCAKAMP
jgi:hypothetical protein